MSLVSAVTATARTHTARNPPATPTVVTATARTHTTPAPVRDPTGIAITSGATYRRPAARIPMSCADPEAALILAHRRHLASAQAPTGIATTSGATYRRPAARTPMSCADPEAAVILHQHHRRHLIHHHRHQLAPAQGPTGIALLLMGFATYRHLC